MKIVAGSSAFKLRGNTGEELPRASFVARTIDVQGPPVRTTEGDAVLDIVMGPSSSTEYDFTLSDPFRFPATIAPRDSSQIRVQGEKLVPIVPGSVFAVVDVASGAGRRAYGIDFPGAQASVIDKQFVSWVAGSLSTNILANMATVLNGKAPGAARQHLWATQTLSSDPAQCAATVNPTCLIDPNVVGFTSFVQNEGHKFPGKLIGPRHVLANKHVVGVGTSFIWRRPDGSFVKASITQLADLGADLAIGYLSAAVTGVTPMLLLPDDTATKLPSLVGPDQVNFALLPSLIVSANPSPGLGNVQHVQVIMVRHIVPGGTPGRAESTYLSVDRVPAPQAGFTSLPYGGDSGSPVLLPITIAGTVRWVYATSLYGPESGPPSVGNVARITAAMNSTAAAAGDATVYAAPVADLSAFSSF